MKIKWYLKNQCRNILVKDIQANKCISLMIKVFFVFRHKFGSSYKNKKKIIIVSYRIEDTKFYTHNNTFFVDSQKAKPSDVYQINQIENIFNINMILKLFYFLHLSNILTNI